MRLFLCYPPRDGAGQKMWQALLKAPPQNIRKLLQLLLPLAKRGDALGSVCSTLRNILAQRPEDARQLLSAFEGVLDDSMGHGNAIEDAISCVKAICAGGTLGCHAVENHCTLSQLVLAKHGKGANRRGRFEASEILEQYFVPLHDAYYLICQLKNQDLGLGDGYYSRLSATLLPDSARKLLAVGRNRQSLQDIGSGDVLCLIAKALARSQVPDPVDLKAAHILKEKFIRSILVLERCCPGGKVASRVQVFFPTWYSFYGVPALEWDALSMPKAKKQRIAQPLHMASEPDSTSMPEASTEYVHVEPAPVPDPSDEWVVDEMWAQNVERRIQQESHETVSCE